MDESWATLWEAVADAMPERVALVHGDQRLRWEELDDRAARFAAALAGVGVGRDSKVAFLAYNTPEHLEGVFGVHKLRGCPLNLNFRYREDELVDVLVDADAEVVVFHGSMAELVAAARRRLPRLRAVVQIDDGSPLLEGAFAYQELVGGHDPAPRVRRSGDDVLLLYTGGTTGSPRGVMWRHRDAVEMNAFAAYTLAGLATPADAADAARCAVALRDQGLTPIVLPASPLVHGTALFLSYAAWLLGGTVVFLESRRFDPHELWACVERERVTEIGIVGDAFARPMAQALEEAEAEGRAYDVSSVNRVLSSGAPWSARWKQDLLDRGSMTLVETIGASEGGPLAICVLPPGSRAEDARFVLGDRATLLDEDGRELAPGSERAGLMAIRPPIPLGYHKDPDKSALTFVSIGGQEYSIPGDYAHLDADGTVRFVGRGSLCINTGGEKVYPEETEAAIRDHPAVLDANVVGLPDERFGEAVTAVVSLLPGMAVSEEEIRDSVRTRLAGYKVPRRVVFVDHIPRSPAGKARYDWARDAAAAGVGIS